MPLARKATNGTMNFALSLRPRGRAAYDYALFIEHAQSSNEGERKTAFADLIRFYSVEGDKQTLKTMFIQDAGFRTILVDGCEEYGELCANFQPEMNAWTKNPRLKVVPPSDEMMVWERKIRGDGT